MSVREILLKELARQPDEVAQKLLDYLHALTPQRGSAAHGGETGGHFAAYWNRYYGALEGKEWEEPTELPIEKREEW